jgi:hypothetical protein
VRRVASGAQVATKMPLHITEAWMYEAALANFLASIFFKSETIEQGSIPMRQRKFALT